MNWFKTKGSRCVQTDYSKSEYESWGDSDDDNNDDDQQSDDERTEFNDDNKADDINKTDDDDEDVDDEEFDRINKEMYSDVNVELKDSEHEGEGKDDEEMTNAGQVDAEYEETEVPLQSSSISSDYATKFLNFDNIPSGETEIISMMDDKVQHEDPSIQTSPFLNVPVSVIPESSTAPATTITSLLSSLFPNIQQSTPIPTPITTKETTPTTVVPNSKTLSAIHQRLFDVENEVNTLRNVDNSSTIRATVKSKVPIVVKEYLGTSLDDALHKALQTHTAELVKEHFILADVTDVLQQQPKPHKSVADIRKIKMEQAGKKQEPKYTIVSSNVDSLWEFDQKRTLFETMKSFEQNSKHKALYKGKETKPSKKAKSTGTSKGTTKSQPKSTDKSVQAEETVFEAGDTQVTQDLGEYTDPEWNEGKSVENKPTQKWICDLAKAEKPSKTFDDLMSTLIDFSAFVMNHLQISDPTQDNLVGPAYELLKGMCRSYVKLKYNMEECYKALTDQLDWNNPKGDRYPFNLIKPLPLVKSGNRHIVLIDYFFNNDLAYLQGGSTDRTYTTSLRKTKASKYDLKGIKDMVPNLWSPIKVAYDKHAPLGTSHW
ncbi:hypothetical protein Tco_0109149 [Tanacetum coccineum]